MLANQSSVLIIPWASSTSSLEMTFLAGNFSSYPLPLYLTLISCVQQTQMSAASISYKADAYTNSHHNYGYKNEQV
jgi:hypothetical protein